MTGISRTVAGSAGAPGEGLTKGDEIMAKPVRFKLDRAWPREMLTSPTVAALIEDRAYRVGNALDAVRWKGRDDWEIVVDVGIFGDRVVGIVSGVPTRVEEAERIMGAALGAAQ